MSLRIFLVCHNLVQVQNLPFDIWSHLVQCCMSWPFASDWCRFPGAVQPDCLLPLCIREGLKTDWRVWGRWRRDWTPLAHVSLGDLGDTWANRSD